MDFPTSPFEFALEFSIFYIPFFLVHPLEYKKKQQKSWKVLHELTKGADTTQVVGFLRALRLSPKIKTGRHEIDQKRCLEVALKHRKSRQIKSYLFFE